MLTPTQTPSQPQTLITTSSQIPSLNPITNSNPNSNQSRKHNFKEKFIPVFDSYPFPKLNTSLDLNLNPYTNSTPGRESNFFSDSHLAPKLIKEVAN